jgi:predicted PurR-regulated permease PerM
MIAWGLMVSSVDNIIKPLIIRQGSPIPFVLILVGVLGGALAFGFIGVFLGPTLLAVGFRILTQWNAGLGTAPEGAGSATPGAACLQPKAGAAIA